MKNPYLFSFLNPFPTIAFAPDGGTGAGGTGTGGNDSDNGGADDGNKGQQGGDTDNGSGTAQYATVDDLNRVSNGIQTLTGLISKLMGKKGDDDPGDDDEVDTDNDDNSDDAGQAELKPVDPKEVEKKVLEKLEKEQKRKNSIIKAAKAKALEHKFSAQTLANIEDIIPTSSKEDAVAFIDAIFNEANAIATARFNKAGQEPGSGGKGDDKKGAEVSVAEKIAEELNTEIDAAENLPASIKNQWGQ